MKKFSDGNGSNILKGVFMVFCLGVFVFAAFMYNTKVEKTAEEATDATVGIHVKGAVENTGFYLVPMGTRVGELGEYIGGFSDEADLDGVNLAEYVKDGAEIYVPYKGTPEKGALDLNSVTYEELLYVKGIGETYAGKIINYRNTHGSFKRVIELKDILDTKVYENVRESFYVK